MPTGEHQWVTPEAFSLISEREFQDSVRLLRLRRQRNLAMTVATLVLIAFVVSQLVWWRLAARRVTAMQGVGESVTRPGTNPRDSARVSTPFAESPSDASIPRSISLRREIERTVATWAAAWSAQDVDRYLSFYAARFELPAGFSRSGWESYRRQRISSPRQIVVTVSDLEAKLTTAGTVTVSFGQGYSSPGYRDQVAKTLELMFEAGRWQIVSERSSTSELAAKDL